MANKDARNLAVGVVLILILGGLFLFSLSPQNIKTGTAINKCSDTGQSYNSRIGMLDDIGGDSSSSGNNYIQKGFIQFKYDSTDAEELKNSEVKSVKLCLTPSAISRKDCSSQGFRIYSLGSEEEFGENLDPTSSSQEKSLYEAIDTGEIVGNIVIQGESEEEKEKCLNLGQDEIANLKYFIGNDYNIIYGIEDPDMDTCTYGANNDCNVDFYSEGEAHPPRLVFEFEGNPVSIGDVQARVNGLTLTLTWSWVGGESPWYYQVIDFGDRGGTVDIRTTKQTATRQHTYDAPGTYQVTIKVSDFGSEDIQTFEVKIGGSSTNPADTNQDGTISTQELIDYAELWLDDLVSTQELLDAASIWVNQ